MNSSQAINELATALSEAQSKIKGADKTTTNPFFNKKYASLESVWESVQGPLTENGLSVTQGVTTIGEHPFLETILMHSSGQWVSFACPLLLEKQDMQKLGSAITYARRFGLLAICSAPTLDDDGETAVGRDAGVEIKSKPLAPPIPPKPAIAGNVNPVLAKLGPITMSGGEFQGETIEHAWTKKRVRAIGYADQILSEIKAKKKLPEAMLQFVDYGKIAGFYLEEHK